MWLIFKVDQNLYVLISNISITINKLLISFTAEDIEVLW